MIGRLKNWFKETDSILLSLCGTIALITVLAVLLIVFCVYYSREQIDQGTVIEKEFVQESSNGKTTTPDRWYLTVEGENAKGEIVKDTWAVPPMVYRDIETGDQVIKDDVVVQ